MDIFIEEEVHHQIGPYVFAHEGDSGLSRLYTYPRARRASHALCTARNENRDDGTNKTP